MRVGLRRSTGRPATTSTWLKAVVRRLRRARRGAGGGASDPGVVFSPVTGDYAGRTTTAATRAAPVLPRRRRSVWDALRSCPRRVRQRAGTTSSPASRRPLAVPHRRRSTGRSARHDGLAPTPCVIARRARRPRRSRRPARSVAHLSHKSPTSRMRPAADGDVDDGDSAHMTHQRRIARRTSALAALRSPARGGLRRQLAALGLTKWTRCAAAVQRRRLVRLAPGVDRLAISRSTLDARGSRRRWRAAAGAAEPPRRRGEHHELRSLGARFDGDGPRWRPAIGATDRGPPLAGAGRSGSRRAPAASRSTSVAARSSDLADVLSGDRLAAVAGRRAESAATFDLRAVEGVLARLPAARSGRRRAWRGSWMATGPIRASRASVAERRFRELCWRHGLPPPRRPLMDRRAARC